MVKETDLALVWRAIPASANEEIQTEQTNEASQVSPVYYFSITRVIGSIWIEIALCYSDERRVETPIDTTLIVIPINPTATKALP